MVYILHDSSLVVCFSNISTYFVYSEINVWFSEVRFCPFLARWRVGIDSFLVLVFAATRSEMALRSVLLIRIGNQNLEIKYI